MQPHRSTPSPDLAAQLLAALKHWHDGDSIEGLLDTSLLFHQMATVAAEPPRQTNNRLLRQTLSALRICYPLDADLLEMRYRDGWSPELVANRLDFAENKFYSHQCRAVLQLVATLTAMERAAWQAREQQIDARIEAPACIEPVGIDAQVRLLAALIAEPVPPWVVSIEGFGGIGKTVLADALVRRLSKSLAFDDFAWTSAQPMVLDAYGAIRAKERPALPAAILVNALLQQLMPDEASGLLAQPEQAQALLHGRLKRAPHLVVVDNLETIIDLEALLPLLRSLANPSKFVLTACMQPSSGLGVYRYRVCELSEEHAFALIRQTARRQNIVDLLTATDADLQPLYATVGGNPLALLLVAGQIRAQALDTVLHDLRHARGASAETLYTSVYLRAWDSLNPASRRVLLTMSLVNARGDTLDFITTTSELPQADVVNALQHLTTLNLVNTTGDLHRRRYLIHGLTRSFLREQVARWA